MFKEPTYESYVKATDFARFRYKYGLFVTFAALICFIILILFVWNYGEELGSHPLLYASENLRLNCVCVEQYGNFNTIYSNATEVSYKPLLNQGGLNYGFYRGDQGFTKEIEFNNTRDS